MAYVLVILAALGLFLWATPAHTVIVDNLRRVSAAISETTASGSMPFKTQTDSALATIRAKSTKLLREQLRHIIDAIVR